MSHAIGKHDFEAQSATELSFKKGDVMEIIKNTDTGWVQGTLNGQKGWFPSDFVDFFTPQQHEQSAQKEEAQAREKPKLPTKPKPRRKPMPRPPAKQQQKEKRENPNRKKVTVRLKSERAFADPKLLQSYIGQDKTKREVLRRRLQALEAESVQSGRVVSLHLLKEHVELLPNRYDGKEVASSPRVLAALLDQFEHVLEYRTRVFVNELAKEKDPKLAPTLPTPVYRDDVAAAALQHYFALFALDNMPSFCAIMQEHLIKYDSDTVASLMVQSNASSSSAASGVLLPMSISFTSSSSSSSSTQKFEQVKDGTGEFFILETLELGLRAALQQFGNETLMSVPWSIVELVCFNFKSIGMVIGIVKYCVRQKKKNTNDFCCCTVFWSFIGNIGGCT
jgi:SH3 domain